jgi:hypothetical protein
VKFSEIAARLNGFSTPIFGLSWEPPRSDVAAARQVITFLEDKRALYNPYMAEQPTYVIESISDIRRQMTATLGAGGLAENFVASLRTIRAACRKFTDGVGARTEGGRLFLPDGLGIHYAFDLEFIQRLGEWRGVVGVEVAKIAAAHGLDIEERLASILPVGDSDQS